jgi:hypothetical protein
MSNFTTNYTQDAVSSGSDTVSNDNTPTFIRGNHIHFDEIVVDGTSDECDSELTSVSDSDSDSDLNSENIYDEINQTDYEHFYSEKENGKYYIGMSQYDNINNTILFSTTISPAVYFQYSYRECSRYLYYYGLCAHVRPGIDIMQLQISDKGIFSVVVKTFWLKLVQRKWKKIYKQRQEIITKRANPFSLHHREVSGSWQSDITYLPGIRGLMV